MDYDQLDEDLCQHNALSDGEFKLNGNLQAV